MKATFKVKQSQYEVTLQKRERGEDDKFNPFAATLSGQQGGGVSGTCQITDAALESAGELEGKGVGSAEELLARACGKSLASELVIRKLESDFSFVVDHRWVGDS